MLGRLLLLMVAGLALLPGLAPAQPVQQGLWTRANADFRMGYETVKLPGGEHMGLLGTSYLVELERGLCVGPAVYGAVSGQHGGLFTVGAEAALCTQLIGPLGLEAGLYVGAGGGGDAPVGGGLMLRPHIDLLWGIGDYRLGVSVSKVRFPSGDIDSTQFGLVFGMNTDFTYLPSGRTPAPYYGLGRTGLGFDRILAVGGVYRPRAGETARSGAPLSTQIGYVGMRAERFYTANFYGGLETNGAVSGGAAGYAELLGTLGLEWSLWQEQVTLGGRIALGMGGGGDVPVGGGLLAKAALGASVRVSRDVSLSLEGGWVTAPQGDFNGPFGALALRWDLEHAEGSPTKVTREEFAAGVETYRNAARKGGPPQNLQNLTFKFNRFVSPSLYITGQVHSAYAGDAGGFSVGLIGLGAQTRVGERLLVGAEMLAGAAGGGGVATGNGGVVQPMAYVGWEITPLMSLRLGAGKVKATNGSLDSTVADLTLVLSFGVASRP